MKSCLNDIFLLIEIAIASLWVAICAVAPEFVWRGANVVVRHADKGDFAAALLVGLILACFVEPGMERLRGILSKTPASERHSDNLLFTVLVGFSFTLISFVIHDAVTSFMALHAEDQAARWAGMMAGIRLASSWAVVPFCVTFAWLCIEQKFLRWPLAVIAAISPLLAMRVFSWSAQDWVATQIPCLIILAVGYRLWKTGAAALFFRRCAVSLLWICPLWIFGALFFDALMNLATFRALDLYTYAEAWIDVRFYIGWIIGLMLAPIPAALANRHR